MHCDHYEPHPIAAIFPVINEDGLKTLTEDIRQHGLRQPIVLYEGKVLDGRNRLRACIAAGVKPTFTTFDGQQSDAISFAWSVNVERRHLNSSQLAMALVKREELDAEYAKAVEAVRDDAQKRKALGGGDRKSAIYKHAKSVTQLFESPNRNVISTDARLAAAAGTNRQYIADARMIRERDHALADAIERGEKTIPQAKRVIRKSEQIAQLEDIASQKAKKITDAARICCCPQADTVTGSN